MTGRSSPERIPLVPNDQLLHRRGVYPDSGNSVGLTQAQAYRLADNQTVTLSVRDGKLAQELAQLEGMDFDLNLTGFSADELSRLLASG
jgi:hypothetical protein